MKVLEIKEVYKIFFLSGLTRQKAIEKMETSGFASDEAAEFILFVKDSKRPIATHLNKGRSRKAGVV